MAWLNMSIVRKATLAGPIGTTEGVHALMGAQSTKNFDELFGISSESGLEPILRAQVVSLQGNSADALVF
jgi:hypothetical protein